MKKITIAYWSSTGNTEQMAQLIGKGVEEAGAQPQVIEMEQITSEELLAQEVFALGCPAMGDEELDDSVVEPFVSAIESKVSGKTILLFGSYDWGDGEWMRNWSARMEKSGAKLLIPDGLIANNEPDDEAQSACREAGKKMAEA